MVCLFIYLFIGGANHSYIGVSRLCAPKGPTSGAVQESDVRLTPELPVTASVMVSMLFVLCVGFGQRH